MSDDRDIELDEAAFIEQMNIETFLASIAAGVPEMVAGIEIGWTPLQTRARCADPEFAELVRIYKDMSIDYVEKALMKLATGGHLGAIQMVLYNKRSETWRDVRRLEVRTEHTVAPELVTAARDVVLAALAKGGVAALQPGGHLDAIETVATES